MGHLDPCHFRANSRFVVSGYLIGLRRDGFRLRLQLAVDFTQDTQPFHVDFVALDFRLEVLVSLRNDLGDFFCHIERLGFFGRRHFPERRFALR